MTEALLQTKLFIPPVEPELVVRQRLLERLHPTPRQRLTLISAPAGFGKTTLIAHWLTRQDKFQVSWFSLDEQDNDPGRFFSYLIAALQQIEPTIGQTIQATVQSTPTFAADVVLTTLINDITTHNRPLILVLDDFHLIENEAIYQAVEFLIEHRPPNLYLFITSRTELPFSVAKWRVRRQMMELAAADLRFTPAETADFFQQVMQLDLPTEAITQLEHRTEGWAAGLQLAALSLSGRDDPQPFLTAFTGDNRYISDYLLEEVFSQQPDHIRDFLLCTSILDRFCAELCDVVLDNEVPPSQKILAELERRNLFLIPLDEQRRWFRYHHLFADFLRGRLARQYSERIETLNGRAGRWYIAHKQLDEGVRYLVRGREWATIADIIIEHGLDLIVNGEIQKLANWYAPLPAELLDERPLLHIYAGWMLMFLGQLDKADAHLDAIARHHDTPDFPLTSMAKAARAFTLNNRGRPAESLPLAQAAITELDEALARQDDPLKRRIMRIQQSAAIISVADVYAQQNRLSEARPAYERALRANQEAGNILAALGATWSLGTMLMVQGKLRHAAVVLQKGFQLARQWAEPDEHGRFPLLATSNLHHTYGLLLYEQNQLTEARRHLEHALMLGQLGGTFLTIETAFALGLLETAEGNLDAAEQQYQEAAAALAAQTNPEVAVRLRPTQYQLATVLYLQRPEPTGRAQLEQWWQASIPEMETSWIEIDYARHRMTMAFALGFYDELLAQVPQWLADTAQERQGFYLAFRLLQALGLYGRGEETAALEELAAVLDQAEPEGYVRLFADLGAKMMELLQLAHEREISPAYTADLLRVMGADPAGTSPLIEPLSEREQEVLQLMAQGLAYQAIADELIVSVNTVRYHTKNLYGKLGVNSRAQALAKAHELKLLEI